MEEKEFRELLTRAAYGEITSQEQEKLERLIQQIDYSKEQRSDLKQIQNEVKNNIVTNLKAKKRLITNGGILKYAAAIVMLVVGYYSFFIFKSNDQTIKESTANINFIESYSEYGQQNNLKLSDGSQVKLNAGTKLIYPEKFTGEQRKLTLEGQAFFTVARDTTKPFVIEAGKFQVMVLGTSFDIKAFDDDHISSITVLTGKVSVAIKGHKERVVLTPNDRLIYNIINNEYSIQTVDAQRNIAWVNGILRFDESYLQDVFKEMQRWYDITIIVNDGLNTGCTVSGRHKNQGFNIILEGLQYTHGLEYNLRNDTILITNINCD